MDDILQSKEQPSRIKKLKPQHSATYKGHPMALGTHTHPEREETGRDTSCKGKAEEKARELHLQQAEQTKPDGNRKLLYKDNGSVQ